MQTKSEVDENQVRNIISFPFLLLSCWSLVDLLEWTPSRKSGLMSDISFQSFYLSYLFFLRLFINFLLMFHRSRPCVYPFIQAVSLLFRGCPFLFCSLFIIVCIVVSLRFFVFIIFLPHLEKRVHSFLVWRSKLRDRR